MKIAIVARTASTAQAHPQRASIRALAFTSTTASAVAAGTPASRRARSRSASEMNGTPGASVNGSRGRHLRRHRRVWIGCRQSHWSSRLRSEPSRPARIPARRRDWLTCFVTRRLRRSAHREQRSDRRLDPGHRSSAHVFRHLSDRDVHHPLSSVIRNCPDASVIRTTLNRRRLRSSTAPLSTPCGHLSPQLIQR